MSSINNNYRYQAPSLLQPLSDIFPNPIAAKRNPRTSDNNYPIGQVWSNVLTSTVYVLASVTAGSATWTTIGGAGAGVFTSLTVTPGPITFTGTFTETGASTFIGALTQTGGTVSLSGDAVAGLVNIGTGAAAKTVTIGNITGATEVDINVGSGGFTVATTTGTVSIGAGASDHTTTVGSVTGVSATTLRGGTAGITLTAPFVALPGPVYIYTGAGAPAGGLGIHVGDLYINTTAASAVTRMYICTAAGVWTNFTCAA